MTADELIGVLDTVASDADLADVLVQRGHLTHAERAEAAASAAGVPLFDDTPIAPRVAHMVPVALSRRHRLIPVAQRRARVVIAMVDPLDVEAQESVVEATGLRVDVVAIADDTWRALADRHLVLSDEAEEPDHDQPTSLFDAPAIGSRRSSRRDPVYADEEGAVDLTEQVAVDVPPVSAAQRASDDTPTTVAAEHDRPVADDLPVAAARAPEYVLPADQGEFLPDLDVDDDEVDVVRSLLAAMAASGATAVHIDVTGGAERVTARLGGPVVQWHRPRPVAAAVSHAAGIPLRRRPVHAQATLEGATEGAVVHVLVTPTETGQSIVLRPAPASALPQAVADAVALDVESIVRRPRGLILVASPDATLREAVLDVVRATVPEDRRVITLASAAPVTDAVVVPAGQAAAIATVMADYDADLLVARDIALIGDAVLDLAGEALVIAGVRAPDAAAALHRVARMTDDSVITAHVAVAALSVSRIDGAGDAGGVKDTLRHEHLDATAPIREALADDAPLTELRRVASAHGLRIVRTGGTPVAER